MTERAWHWADDVEPPAPLPKPSILLAHDAIVGPWTCALHKTHGQAKPLRGAVHHVWPRGAGGPDEPANRITVCETGHANTHHLMWQLVNGNPITRLGTKTERSYAQRGVDEWTAAGKPGSITAFMA